MMPFSRALALAALLTIAIVGCSSPKQDAAPVNVAVTIGATTVANAGAPIEVSDEQRASITRALTTYVRSATADPLTLGSIGGDLGTVFTPEALAAATGPDRAALFDEELPTGRTTIAPITATINGLGGADNRLVVLAATMTVDASTESKQGPVKVTRTVMFAFAPTGETWKVHAYDASVTREVSGTTTTVEGQR